MAARANEVSPPSSVRKPLLRQTRAVSRMKSVSDGTETSPLKEEGNLGDTEETTETHGVPGDSVQRNLSLEALFQVTHSELKNISRTEDDPDCHRDSSVNGKLPAAVEPSVVAVNLNSNDAPLNDTNTSTPPVLMQLETVSVVHSGIIDGAQLPASKELTVLSSQMPEEEEMIVDDMNTGMCSMRAATPQQLQICVEVTSVPPELHPEVELSDASPDSKLQFAKGHEKYPLTSESLDDQRLKLVYTKKKYDQYELSEGSPDGKHAVVKLPVSGKGVEKYQVKSDSLEEQGLKLTYTKKTYDQYEPNPITYGTYKPRSFKPTPQTSVDPSLHDSGSPQGGRKRKYPAKPGRHICLYCGRGCAKPSVLQKHIRAHTGERPYPCPPCGFSFKTKSNLYKHCKSRAHAIKAGLSPSVDDPNKDLNKSKDGSFCEEDGESDMESEEGRMSDSSTRDGSSRSASVETGDNTQSAGSSFDSVRSRSKDDPYAVQCSGNMEVMVEDVSVVDGTVRTSDGGVLIINNSNGTPQIVRTSCVYKTDKQYFDIKQDVMKSGSPIPTTPLSETSHVSLTKMAVKRPSQVNSPLLAATSSDHLNVTSVVQKESDNSMKVTIKYPKVTKQQAISFDQNTKLGKSLSVGSSGSFRRSASLPEHAQIKLETGSPSSIAKDSKVVTPEAVRDRLIRLQASQPKVASIDHKSMTPDMIGERISQLISNNAALLDMPMADAPRPKRMSRQNSEVKADGLSTPSRGILSPSLSLDSGASNRLIFQGHGRAKSMDVKMSTDTDKKISFLHQDSQGNFLSQAEPTDQPPGSAGGAAGAESRMMAELVAAAKTATPVAPSAISTPTTGPSTTPPQEMRIQIKLPKSATTDGSGTSLTTTSLSSAPMGLSNASQSYIGQPSVLLPTSSGVLMRQLSLPHLSLTQQQATDSSVIRELLLKGGQPDQPGQQGGDGTNPAAPPSIQMVEIRPDGSTSVINDFTPVVMVDSKGVTTTTYMTPVTQDPVAMNVAQDVEVVATSEGLHVTSPRAQLKRATSLPQGIPTASGSSSPYGNVVFDHYDPKVPPKRGRPKGSKNRVREQLSLNIPKYGAGSVGTTNMEPGSSPAAFNSSLRMPFMTSQSLNSSPAVVSVAATRPPLRLTIPQPSVTPTYGVNMGTPVLTASSSVDSPNVKLKLKGKLLMKRSMSVERMLFQEREKRNSMGTSMPSMDENLPTTPVQGISSPAILSRSSSTLLTPTSYISNPLLRAASADEATPLKKRRAAFQSARSEDSPIRRLLGHYSADSVFHSASTDASDVDPAVSVVMAATGSTPSSVSCALVFDSPEKNPGKIPRIPSLSRQDSLPIPARIPTKLSPLSVMVSPPPTIVVSHGTAPTNQYQPFNHQQQPFMAPLLQLSRAKNMHLPQSLYLSLKLSPNASNIVPSRSLSLSDDKDEAGKVLEKVGSQQSADSSPMDDSPHKPTLKKLSSEGGSMDSVGSGASSTGKGLTEKGVVQVLLMGHQCPTLRMLTHTTFCTLAKPQPMYVPQEASKLSMYSNWRAARFNPNPIGLSSRELMSLHHMRRYDNDPYFTSPTMGPSKTGVLTHSSYWNYYNKMRALQTGEEGEPGKNGEEEMRTIKQVPEVKMATGVQVAEEQEKVIMQQVSAPNIAMETVVITTPTFTKQKSSKEPKRLKIFAGGYKTNEEYIYIRGRGRGKYVCEECGIRCKKPSMLRKHIRTHTDVRPYLCKHCTFSFKTKGNLTKHMKSKAHQKKCIELGITPVPITVDDSQIDPEALALQAQMAKDGRMPSEDDDGEFTDGDDEDEDEDEEDDSLETMTVVDAITGEVKETIRCQVVRKDTVNSTSEGPQYVAIQEGDSGQPTLVKIDAKTQVVLMQQASANSEKEVTTEESVEGEVAVSRASDDPESDAPRPSIDKEIAHSLLDLSKGNEPAKKGKGAISLETRRLLRQHSAHAAEEKEKDHEESKDAEDPDGKADGTRLDSLIGALISRTKGPGDGSTVRTATTVEAGHHGPPSMVRMATTIYQSAAQPSVRGQPSTSDLQHIHRRSQNTYAQKIAALQTANENDLRVTLSRSRVNATGSGFVPPVIVMDVTDDVRTNATPVLTTASSKSMLRRQASVGGLSEAANNDKRTESQFKAGSEDRPMNLTIDKDDGISTDGPGPSISPLTTSIVSESSEADQSATGENSAASETMSVNKLPDAPPLIKDGTYTCPFCDKIFSEFSQYAYHKNIHYIERTHRCEECSLSFRTRAHLKKHMRSEVHQNKQTVNQQYGTPSSDNPRPFKCDDCNIAFRIHGHLAKHVRSKSHIVMLEKLGKAVPEGAATEEAVDSDIEVLDEVDISLDADEDSEVAHASAKQANIEHTLKDPENILQPRETTPDMQESQGATSISSLTTPTSTPMTQPPPHCDSSGSTSTPVTVEGLESDQFHYHKLGDYEKDFNASNEKVTVEKIKMEPIDIGTFSSLGSRVEMEPEQFAAPAETQSDAAERVARNREVFRHQAGSGSGEQHPHKCGICGRTFRAISTLKQHLVTHAELRPYVCEYCDAGFTTAQSLKFHLRTHTQGRPYICGQCGDTFARSDNLREHMHFHEERDDEPFTRNQKAPTPVAVPAAPRPNVMMEPQPTDVLSSGAVAGSPVILTTSPPYASIKPRPANVHQTLRPSQGQLLRSVSADQHLVRDIRPKGPDVSTASSTPALMSEATRRRMAFTSSISLPLQSGAFQSGAFQSGTFQSGAVQFVPMIQSGQPGELIQLVPQPLGMRMPMIQVQNAPGTPGAFSGQLQTVLAPSSSSMQTLVLQSPMVLSSMPVIQQLATPTPQAIGTPTHGLATPTHPLAVPTHPLTMPTHPLVTHPLTSTHTLPTLNTTTQSTNAVSSSIMTTPTITITMPTRVTVSADDHEERMACNPQSNVEPVLIPTVVLEKEEEDGSKQRKPLNDDQPQSDTSQHRQIPQVVEVQSPPAPPPPLPHHIMTSPVITITPPDGQTVTEHVPTPLPPTPPGISTVSQPQPLPVPITVSQQQEAAQPVHSNTVLADAGRGRRTLATRLIPENNEAQERLVMALEEQGLCHDKVRVVPINDDNTQFMIVQLDDFNKLDDRAIEELINQNKAQITASQHVEVASDSVTTPVSDTQLLAEATAGDVLDISDDMVTDDDITESVVMKDVMLKGASILSSSVNARRKAFLKRQHSVDLADQSASGMRGAAPNTPNSMTAGRHKPPAKIRVTENSHGECIPQPVTSLEAKGQS